MLLKACVNGARGRDEHVALPTTAIELGRDAQQVQAAGAEAVHLHVKNSDGGDTFDPALTDAAVSAVRHAAPGLPIGLTTGAWAEPNVAARLAAITAWNVLPDFASVNWHEDGAEEVAGHLLERGIAVEAGLWHTDAIVRWSASPLRPACMRVLVELPADLPAVLVPEHADDLLRRLIDVDAPIVLHGEDGSCWPALRHAARRGLATRIGLEDTLVLSDGSSAPDNATLVAEALALLQSHTERTEGTGTQ